MKKLLLVFLFCFSSLFAFEELTTENFDQKIANKNVVVDFHAVWWGACKVLGKNLTKYSTSDKPNDVEIYKVDIGEQGELAARFKAFAVPMLIYFKDGKEMARERGVKSPSQIAQSVNKYLK